MNSLFNNNPIGVLDSGIGGLTVLQALRAKLPFEHFIYWGDSKHAPYGSATQEMLLKYVSDIIDFFLEKNVKTIVIACNTVSGKVLQIIQNKYPDMIFIGMIDHGLSRLEEYCILDTLCILATESTINEGYYYKKVIEIFPTAEVSTKACPMLVLFAEKEEIEGAEVDSYIRYISDGIVPFTNCIILACTHFPIFLPAFQGLFPPNTIFYNPAFSVADSLKEIINVIGPREYKEGKIDYYSSGNKKILDEFVNMLL